MTARRGFWARALLAQVLALVAGAGLCAGAESEGFSELRRLVDAYEFKKGYALKQALTAYRAELDAVVVQAVKAGNLRGSIAVKKEVAQVMQDKVALAGGETVFTGRPADDAPIEVWAAWRAYVTDRTARLTEVRREHLTGLERLQKANFRNEDLDAAIATREEQRRVAKEHFRLAERLLYPPAPPAPDPPPVAPVAPEPPFALAPGADPDAPLPPPGRAGEAAAERAGEGTGGPEAVPPRGGVSPAHRLKAMVSVVRPGLPAGRAFACRLKDHFFVVTTIGVLSAADGFELVRSDGRPLQGGGVFLAENQDLAMVKVPEQLYYLEPADDPGALAPGDALVYPVGPTEAVAGGRQEHRTRLTDIGPLDVGVEAQFEAEEEGSPIVDPATGRVIAVAARSSRFNLDVLYGSEDEIPLRESWWYGARIDRVEDWVPVEPGSLARAGSRLRDVRRLTEDLVEMIKTSGRRFGKNPEIQTVRAVLSDRMSKRNMTPDYYDQAIGVYVTRLKFLGADALEEATREAPSPFLRRHLQQQAQYRQKLAPHIERYGQRLAASSRKRRR